MAEWITVTLSPVGKAGSFAICGMASHKMRSEQFAREAISRFGAQYARIFTTTVAGVILARVLGPSDHGALSIVILTVTLTQGVLTSGMVQAMWFFTGKDAISREVLWTVVTGYALAVGMLAGVLLAFVGQTGSRVFQGIEQGDFALACISLPLSFWVSMARPLAVRRGAMRTINIVDVVGGCSYLVGSILFCLILEWGVRGGIATYLLEVVVDLVIIVTLSKIRLSTNWERVWRSALRSAVYGSKAAVGLFAQTLNYRLDFFLVSYFLGKASTGLYTIATSYSEFTLQLSVATQTVGFAHFGDSTSERQDRTVAPIVRITLLLTAAICLIWMPLAHIIIPLVFGREYSGAVLASNILCLGMVGLSGVKILYPYLISGKGRPSQASMALIVGLIGTVVLDLALIPSYGMTGAAIASTVAYWLSFAALVVMATRYSGRSWGDFIGINRSDIARVLALASDFRKRISDLVR